MTSLVCPRCNDLSPVNASWCGTCGARLTLSQAEIESIRVRVDAATSEFYTDRESSRDSHIDAVTRTAARAKAVSTTAAPELNLGRDQRSGAAEGAEYR
jgi:hypothetical protein